MDVGIRDLKAHLSDYIDQAAAGKSLTVTKRGRPVARIVPSDGVDGLEKLAQEGTLTRGTGVVVIPEGMTPLRGKGKSAVDYVREGRR